VTLTYRGGGKRCCDVVVAALLLVVLAIPLGMLALLIKFTLGSPVLFRQTRPGLHGRLFRLVKLRTMSDARDEKGRLLPDGHRLGSVGKFLRASSLDELPELINVVRGEMSLVGPRPLLVEYLDRYNAHQVRRHEVMPGITGLAQVSGRNALSWEQKLRLDVWYADNYSLALDMKILALTVWQVIARRGINQPGHATAEEFMGTQQSGVL
jgi:sugar transferase EpsL